MKDLKGKVAVVTGGASGIGFGLAERFAAEGMSVVIADVEEAALSEAARHLRADGADVLEVVTDVRHADQVAALAKQSVDRFGAVHVVCNNAGVSGGQGGHQVWEIPLEDWEWTLGVNLWGVIHGVRAFVPLLVAQGEGHIVNTASMAGLITGGGPYGVSKFGVVSLSEGLFLALQAAAPSVGVSVLCPGWVNTRIADSERNRPAALSLEATDPQADKVRKGLNRVLGSAMAPSRVADKVVAAIRESQFYILPHDDDSWLTPVRERMTDILERRNPVPRPVPGSEVIMAAATEAD